VAQSGAAWGGCQNKLCAFLHLVCKSLVFNALKLQKKCAEMYEGQTKTHLALAGSGISAQSYSLSCHRRAPASASVAPAQQIEQWDAVIAAPSSRSRRSTEK
jgi:hypothetical protein